MTTSVRVIWPGQRRSLARVALLFLITAGAYWLVWVTRVYGGLRARKPASTRIAPAAVAVLLLVPLVDVLLAILLALDLPRAVRRTQDQYEAHATIETEPLAVLLLAAPVAAAGIAIAAGLSPFLVGYLVWPLELPAALAVQSALNRLFEGDAPAVRGPARRVVDGEVVASLVMTLVLAVVLTVALVTGGSENGPKATARPPQPQFSDVAADSRTLWVTRLDNSTLLRFDPKSLRPVGAPITVRRTPLDVATGYGATWVADYQADAVSRIDPSSGREVARIPVGRGPFGVAVGLGSVWVTDFVDRNIVRIDPKANRVLRKIRVGRGPRGIDVGEGSVWAAAADGRAVYRFDPISRRTTPILVGRFCQDVTVGGGRVWVAAPQQNEVLQIDPGSDRLVGKPIGVGLGPSSIDFGAGLVWVANGTDGSVSRIDPHTAKVVGRPIPSGGPISDLTVHGKDVWVLRTDGKVKRVNP